MYTIKNLLGDKEKIWLYLDNDQTCKKFFEMANAEGYTFGNLPYEKWVTGNIIAIHSDGDMGHLPIFAWCMSFKPDIRKVPIRYDFAKYISGEKDYICYETHIKSSNVTFTKF